MPGVTQRKLAQLARVSHTTVSLALRGHPSIPEKTRARIARLALRHRYQPDPMLAALNAYRIQRTHARFKGTLAWLTGFSTVNGWRSMIQAEGYFNGAKARAHELGYQLAEFWLTEPGLTAKRATDVLLARGTRGLIVAPLPIAHGNVGLRWSEFPAVALGYSVAKPRLHLVMNHQFRNMKHLVHQLAGLGYKRIGFAMPAETDDRVDHNYLGGYWVAQHELNVRQPVENLAAPEFNAEVFMEWFRRARPDAVITAARFAHAVVEWFAAAGVSVPRDVGVAVASVPYGDSNISGMDENVHAVGVMAVDTIVGMIHRNERGIPSNPWRILVEGSWRGGRTVRSQ